MGSDSYNVSLSTNPLETVNGSITLSHSKSLEGGNVTSQSNSGAINAFLKLYPGADLALNIATGRSKNFSADSNATSNSLNGILTLVPRKSIRLVFNGDVSSSTTETGGKKTSSTSQNLKSTIALNPSRFINLNVSYDILPEMKQNYSLNTNLPGSLQTNLRYSRSNSGAETYGVSAAWTVSRYIFLNTSYNLTRSHNKTGDTSSSYTISLSIRQ